MHCAGTAATKVPMSKHKCPSFGGSLGDDGKANAGACGVPHNLLSYE